ncbi:hypothetical protein ACIRG5_38795 [Lentzea sp. NPDC102401]|uniref:hypothetical protein n=1 Tax=Lentzea sp. NPDC102401 TaxID=3364128 RepID=UPI00380FE170
MFTDVQILLVRLRAEVERLHNDERGYATETIVVTALLVALALAAVAVLVAKAIQKANSITL